MFCCAIESHYCLCFSADACRAKPFFIFVILRNTWVVVPNFILLTLYHINSILSQLTSRTYIYCYGTQDRVCCSLSFLETE